jgi:hypothetical protein
MLSTLAEPAFGTLFNLCSDANGSSPTTVAEVADMNFTVSTQIEESTTHSTGTPWRTRVATLNDIGGIEVMIRWVPKDATHDDQTGLLAVQIARAERTYQIVETDASATTIEFNAIIQSLKMGRPFAGLRSANCSLMGSGVPDFDA